MKKKLFLVHFCALFFIVSTGFAMQQTKKHGSALDTKYTNLPADHALALALGLKDQNKNPELMVKLFNHAAQLGRAEAQYELGLLEGDKQKAYGLFKQAAMQQHRSACYQLAKLEIDKKDFDAAIYWACESIKATYFIQAQNVKPFLKQYKYSWCNEGFTLVAQLLAGHHGSQVAEKAQKIYENSRDPFQLLCDRGFAAYSKQDYTTAQDMFLKLAEIKHPMALNMLKQLSLQAQHKEIEAKVQLDQIDFQKQETIQEHALDDSCDMRSCNTGAIPELLVEQVLPDISFSKKVNEPILEQLTIKKLRKKASKNNVHAQLKLIVHYGACQAAVPLLRTALLLNSSDEKQFVQLLVNYNALELVKSLAEQEVAEGLYAWGLILHVQKDGETAEKYFQAAADKKYPQACFKLASLYNKKKEIKKALFYYTQSAIYAVAEHEEKFIQLAVDYIKKQSQARCPYAQACSILMLLMSHDRQQVINGVSQCGVLIDRFVTEPQLPVTHILNELHIIEVLQELAKTKSNEYAAYLLAEIYFTLPELKDPPKAISYLKQAAQLNHAEAQAALGRRYSYGCNVKKNTTKALKFLEVSHKQQCVIGTFHLAMAYDQGIIVPQDVSKALELMRSPWLNNYFEALQYRAVALLNDSTIKSLERQKSLDDLERFAPDNSEACFTLGSIYYNRRAKISKATFKKGINYLKIASDAHNSFASYLLGRIYYHGEGIKQNKAKGVEYIKKAAEAGEESAMTDLLNIYYNQSDYAQALPLAKLLLDSHNSSYGAAILALFYARGYSVELDIKKAVQYMITAFKTGGAANGKFENACMQSALQVVIVQLYMLIKSDNVWARTALNILKGFTLDAGLLWKETEKSISVNQRGEI